MRQTTSQIQSLPGSEVCAALNAALAETAVATMLAQNFHWNVTGPNFQPLHELFQTIYEDHFAAQDDLAERIKALDGHAHGQLRRMLESSSIADHDGSVPAEVMLGVLLRAETTLAAILKKCGELAARHGDTLTEDLCIGRGQVHEKFAWFLRAHLK